jgi:hypothetical protein
MKVFTKHIRSTVISLALSFFFLISLYPVASSGNQVAQAAVDSNGCQYFPETNFSVCGKFLQYWNFHGGLAQQGFPISGVFEERNAAPPAGDGNIHKVQYFQRARFEEHTENAAPNDVLLGLLGTEQFTARYNPPAKENPVAGCQFFPETGYNVCGAFLEYWQSHGGLAQQGFPISGLGSEQNQAPPAGDGQVHRVQYFQRARFEEHQELGGQTLLGLLGTEQYQPKYASNPPVTVSPPPAAPTPPPPPPVTQPPATQAPAAGVQFISVQGTSPGRYASVTVQTAANAYCTIDYWTPKGTHSVAAGLTPKYADGGGQASWTWLIGGNTTRGTGTVRVSCGGYSASTSITIG